MHENVAISVTTGGLRAISAALAACMIATIAYVASPSCERTGSLARTALTECADSELCAAVIAIPACTQSAFCADVLEWIDTTRTPPPAQPLRMRTLGLNPRYMTRDLPPDSLPR